jgi:3-(3-hydroxy-phenyl)propionate hydroxylase
MQIIKAIAVGYFFTTRWMYLLKALSYIPGLKKLLLNVILPFDTYGAGIWGKGKASRYLFPQARTKTNGFSDDFYQNGWALVSVGQPVDAQTVSLCEKAGLKAVVLDEKDTNLAEMKTWAAKYKAAFFIVRPDLYVYASGNNPGELCASFISNQENLWN